jgi:PAS domain S-box-containing protein
MTNAELKESIDQYKALYLEFTRKQALLKSLMDSVPDLIFYKDATSVYLGCNKAFEAFAGRTEKEIVGSTDAELFSPETAALFRNMDIEMMKTATFRKNEESVAYPDGRNVVLETLKTPYYDFDGNIIGLIGISRDITERKNREDTIRYLSYHDALTGIYNRAYFKNSTNT